MIEQVKSQPIFNRPLLERNKVIYIALLAKGVLPSVTILFAQTVVNTYSLTSCKLFMEEVLRAPGRNKYRDLPRGSLNLSAPVFAPKDFQSPRQLWPPDTSVCLTHLLCSRDLITRSCEVHCDRSVSNYYAEVCFPCPWFSKYQLLWSKCSKLIEVIPGQAHVLKKGTILRLWPLQTGTRDKKVKAD